MKRPSTRVTPKFDDNDVGVERRGRLSIEDFGETGARTPEKSTRAVPEVSPGGSPLLPALKTFKWGPDMTLISTSKVCFQVSAWFEDLFRFGSKITLPENTVGKVARREKGVAPLVSGSFARLRMLCMLLRGKVAFNRAVLS